MVNIPCSSLATLLSVYCDSCSCITLIILCTSSTGEVQVELAVWRCEWRLAAVAEAAHLSVYWQSTAPHCICVCVCTPGQVSPLIAPVPPTPQQHIAFHLFTSHTYPSLNKPRLTSCPYYDRRRVLYNTHSTPFAPGLQARPSPRLSNYSSCKEDQ
jgi:hypothetical protein